MCVGLHSRSVDCISTPSGCLSNRIELLRKANKTTTPRDHSCANASIHSNTTGLYVVSTAQTESSIQRAIGTTNNRLTRVSRRCSVLCSPVTCFRTKIIVRCIYTFDFCCEPNVHVVCMVLLLLLLYLCIVAPRVLCAV